MDQAKIIASLRARAAELDAEAREGELLAKLKRALAAWLRDLADQDPA